MARRSLLLGVLALAPAPVFAEAVAVAEPVIAAPAAPYFKNHEEGWFWYRDPKLSAPPSPTPAVVAAPPATPTKLSDPRERIKQQSELLEKLQAQAILDPSPQNMRSYLEMHAMVLAQSERFADSWQQVILNTPSLDYTLEAPTGAAAYVKADEDAAVQAAKLSTAADRYGLLFFFRGTCPYCHRLAPVLKTFAERFGFRVLAVSLDGGSLPDYPNPQPNSGAAETLGVDTVPAVFLINPAKRAVAAASFGYVGYSELAERVVKALIQLESPGGEGSPYVRPIPASQGIALSGASP